MEGGGTNGVPAARPGVPLVGQTPTGPAALGERPRQVLDGLLAGNRRFRCGEPRHGYDIRAAAAASAEQHPGALVIGCIDSRVPLEAIFDQDFGSICVARTGGQVLDRAVLGSVEFAVTELKVSLVMVLGHTRCGAVAATLAAVRGGGGPPTPLGYLVDEISPAVAQLGADATVDAVTEAHVRRTVTLLAALPCVREATAAGRLGAVGALYDLDTGGVRLLA